VIAVWGGEQQIIQDDPALTLPHPRAHMRAFVLVPLADGAPETELAGHGPVVELLVTQDVAGDVPAVRRGRRSASCSDQARWSRSCDDTK
jgi:2-amino-4-hydroxy-6-hydroxymethyldihydropteridine diphosphokinase